MLSKPQKQAVEYRNYFLSMDFPVLLLTGDNWRITDVPSERLHFHNCLEIGVCHSDEGILGFYDGNEIPFSRGDISFIPRNIPHTTCSSPGCRSRWSYIFFEPRQLFKDLLTPSAIMPLLQEDARKYLLPAGTSEKISFLASCAIEELSGRTPNQMIARSLLFNLYMEICRYALGHAPGDHQDPPLPEEGYERKKEPALGSINTLSICPALEYIEDNYMNKFPIEVLAEICHLSPTHFRRVFQSIMHISPLSYLNSVRIMNACNLLRNTNNTILSISQMTGFSTLSNFNRHFSELMKVSPREYRKQTLKAGGRSPILEYAGWMEPDSPNMPPRKEIKST